MMSVQLPQYIYERKGFKLVCSRLADGMWTGELELEDGIRVDLDEPMMAHNLIFSEAKALVEGRQRSKL